MIDALGGTMSALCSIRPPRRPLGQAREGPLHDPAFGGAAAGGISQTSERVSARNSTGLPGFIRA